MYRNQDLRSIYLTCNDTPGMLQSNQDMVMLANALSLAKMLVAMRQGQPYLDNCTGSGQVPCSMSGDSVMSKEHRLRVQLGVNDDGMPIVRQIRGKSELELSENIIKAVIASGRIWDYIPRPTQVEPKAKTVFDDYANAWRRRYKTGISDNYNSYLDAKLSVLSRTFGQCYIEDITVDDVMDWLNARAKEVSRKTIKGDWGVLKEIMTSAVEDGLITKNPAKDRRLKNPAVDKGGTKALTKVQITSIRNSISMLQDPRERLALSLLVYTSMRREELLGLRWENIDLENRLIYICEAVTYPKSKPVVKETKTESSVRNIPIADALYEVLAPLAQTAGYILPGRGGKPVSEPTFRRLWKSIGEHIELYGATPINFRTTFATMAVASGVDIKTTQTLLGHSTPDTTLKIYTRQEDTRLPEAMKRMDAFLSSGERASKQAVASMA